MFVLVIMIILALTLYMFYKIRQVRTNRPMEKKWLSSKASIALGLFIALFGINSLFLNQTMVTYIIAAIFIILGIVNSWAGWKMYKHVLPFAIREAEELGNK